MSIQSLQSGNFVLDAANKLKLKNIAGISLVCFKLDNSESNGFIASAFTPLSKSFTSVKFLILNIDQNRQVVTMAKNTATPITTAPLLILYHDGNPHARFAGSPNIQSVAEFLKQILGKLTQAQAPVVPQNMYGAGMNRQAQYATGSKTYVPDIGSQTQSFKGVIKNNKYNNMADEEDEPRLLIPEGIIAHNTPWQSEFIEQ